MSILTTNIGLAEITRTEIYSFTQTSCQLFIFASTTNIHGQYSINIPAQRNLAHNLSADRCGRIG